ncbi:hypothetical protein QBC35DRAFT_446320 [Podospora australis]|uniref:Uncharacterized protein n=1 Tax=Podospora australis TaxID=1536484 RepID=A0AAN6X368_9PEZI|nr:hypothetical protein QBC35DRAFT_446320 [Podospora australis]
MMTEKLREASEQEVSLACAIEASFKKSDEDKLNEIIELKTTISSQFEVILNLSKSSEAQRQVAAKQIEQLETEKAAAVSEREALATEIQMLKPAYEEYVTYADKGRQENQNLEGGLKALIDVSIESQAIQGDCTDENKRLVDQVAILNKELDLIRGVLMDRVSGLRPDLSNLTAVLTDRSGNRKSPKRRYQERAQGTR